MSEAFKRLQFNIPREHGGRKDVFRKYDVLETLGQGSIGTVCKVRVRAEKVGGSARLAERTGPLSFLKRRKRRAVPLDPTLGRHEYALKSIIVDRVSDIFLEELRNEISILRTLDHPNIVRLHEVYSYKKQIYLIMDLCVGGDLYSRVPYSEQQAARYMAQLVSAVCYMHEHGVVHRDLKWENIMHDGPSSIKVIDFGLSKKFESAPMHMRDRVGTLYSMSPQALQGVYSEKTDLWSVGVISYMMLGNQKPFYSKSRRQMVDHIMRATFSFSGQIWDTVSNEGKDFVSKLLVVDPKIRMDALSALKHDWLVKSEAWHEEKPTEALLKKVDGSLYAYKYVSELKKVALNIIAHKSSSNQLDELRRAFQSFDKNRNGTVTFEEFKLALERSTLSEDTLKEVFDSVDINRDGCLIYTEFLAATVEAHGYIAEYRIAEAFDRLDSDGTGYISKKNLQEILGSDCDDVIDGIIRNVDDNKDGKISYKEFLKAFRQQSSASADRALCKQEDSFSIDDDHLLGLDAKIPGGKYDIDEDPSS